jgi:6-phosphogluconolactonase
MTRLTVLGDPEAVARRAADVMANHINDARMRGDDVHIALAGGSTPQRAYELLADMQGTWSHVHLWLSDERCVPADHEDANQRMIDESLVSKLRADDRPTLHGVRGELEPEDSAWLYAQELLRTMGDEPVFDLLLLGLGPDGHTASLFPDHAEARAAEAPVIGVRNSPKRPPNRITFTLPLIARARYTLLLATGAGKREALDGVRANDQRLPPGRLGEGLDEIICDEAAAGEPSASA